LLFTGNVLENILQDEKLVAVLPLIDYLIDGPFIEEQRDLTLLFRGSQNQRILNSLESLNLQKAVSIKWEQ
jgi:anaerobic ribonucleoside-triphosphate reductase activating protein